MNEKEQGVIDILKDTNCMPLLKQGVSEERFAKAFIKYVTKDPFPDNPTQAYLESQVGKMFEDTQGKLPE